MPPSTVFVIYLALMDLIFVAHAVLRIDEILNYGDFRAGLNFSSLVNFAYFDAQNSGYFLCLSYNSIKTFLMVESIFLTTMMAIDRWRLSTFKKVRLRSRNVYCIRYTRCIPG